MVAIPFPPTTAPGLTGYDGGGRLINAMVAPNEGTLKGTAKWRRPPGLKSLFSVPAFGWRGALEVNGGTYLVYRNASFYVTESAGVYTVTSLGSIPGQKPVTIARNMRTGGPDVLCIHEFGAHLLTPTVATALVEPDIAGANSISFLDGYFVVTFPDARFAVSGINDTAFNALDFATAESSPDGLLRVVRKDDRIILLGEQSVEFWGNAGNAVGMPLGKETARRGGVVGPYAVAGWEDGLPSEAPILWVGASNTVQVLNGTNPVTVSTDDLQRAIAADPARADIRAYAYMSEGVPYYGVQLSNATWVFDPRNQAWHERRSYGLTRWRAGGTFYAFGKWLAADFETGAVYEVSATTYNDAGQAMIFEAISGPGKTYPRGYRVTEANFDFASGTGPCKVMISYSDDGGKTFTSPVIREMGPLGAYNKRARLQPAGMTRPQGRVWKLQISDASPVVFLGGDMAIEGLSR